MYNQFIPVIPVKDKKETSTVNAFQKNNYERKKTE